MADQETGCITYPLNGIEYSAEDAELYCCTRTSGVYSSEYEFIVSRSNDDGTIGVGPGMAWIKNGPYAGKVIRHIYTDITEMVTPAILNDKLDRVVLRFDSVQNKSYITVIEGQEAVDPTPPYIVRDGIVYDLGLAIIRVPANDVGMPWLIYSTVLDEEVCGIMRDGVTGIPTSSLQAQFNRMLEKMKDTIYKIEAGTDVMLQSLFNPEGRMGQVQFKDVPAKALYVDLRGYHDGDSVPTEILEWLWEYHGKAAIYAVVTGETENDLLYLPLQYYYDAGSGQYVFSGYYQKTWREVRLSGNMFIRDTISYNPTPQTTDMKHPVGVDYAGKLWVESSQWFYGTQLDGTETVIASVEGATTGDIYLNTTTGYMYKATSPTVWAYIMKLKGENGTNGKDGKNGKDGTSGTNTYIVVERTGATTMSSGAYSQINTAVNGNKMVVLRDPTLSAMIAGDYVQANYVAKAKDSHGSYYEFAYTINYSGSDNISGFYKVYSDNHVTYVQN